jgi:hypothetical protein
VTQGQEFEGTAPIAPWHRQPAKAADQLSSSSGMGVHMPEDLLNAIAGATSGRLRSGYTAHDLSVLLRLFASQQAPPPPRWMAYWWWASLVLLGKQAVPPDALLAQLRCLTRIRAAPHATWWKGVAKNCVASFGAYSPHQLGQLVGHMAALGHVPEQRWTRRLLLACSHAWAAFTPADWRSLLWGLAKLKVRVCGSRVWE